MHKLLITGNGFDIASGLPTKYKDFINYINDVSNKLKYLKEKGEISGLDNFFVNGELSYDELCDKALDIHISVGMEMLYEEFENYFVNWRNKSEHCNKYNIDHFPQYDEVESEIINYATTPDGKGGVDSIHRYKACMLYTSINGNLWIDYFNEILKNREMGENWIDFEQEIYSVISKLENELKDSKNIGEIKRGKSSSKKEIKSITNYMSSFFTNNIVDFMGIAGEQEFIKKIWSELNILVRCLEIYMLFVQQVPVKYINKIPVVEELGDEIDLLTFNYTNTFIRCYKNCNNPNCDFERVEYIHGKAGKNNIIVGINESLEKENMNSLLECSCFKKYFQRIFFCTGMKYRNWLKDLKKKRYEVFIFGHSLDITDSEVLEHIILNKSVKTITIFYHDQKEYIKQINNLTRIIGTDKLIKMTGKQQLIFRSSFSTIKLQKTSR